MDKTGGSLRGQVGVKVLAFVIDDDEGGKIFHFDLPHGFHTKDFESETARVELVDVLQVTQ